MLATRTKRGLSLLVIALTGILFSSLIASAHGYTTSPRSRQLACQQGAVSGCGEIIYEPQSVEGPKGFPGGGPADGTICAGGVARFSQLDNPRNGTWPATGLTSGSTVSFSWKFTAMHATTSYRYFITRNGWNPSAPLTRGSLESAPFLNVPKNGARPGSTETHTGRVPSGKTGRHLVLAVWDIADTANAFYSCADVTF